jgi:pilus assembly protein CpaB
MRTKSLTLLALAGGCGIVASIGISQVLDSHQTQLMIETKPIYVALHNINLGDPIDVSMVSFQDWPKDKIPRGAIAQLEDLEGRRPRTAIIEGEPILEAKLLAAGQIADPISQIPAEMRLVTIAVDAETSAAGLLSPGDRVDIQLFVRRDPRNGIDEPKTRTILQNIRVYAVDQAVHRSAEGDDVRAIAKTISLLLTPEQAGRMNLGEKVGEISLIPRNPDDESMVAWTEITLDELLNDGIQRNSRKKEQQPVDHQGQVSVPRPDSSLTLLEPAEPFRMEIVLADVVTEQLFDAETGKPIRTGARTVDRPQPVSPGSGVWSATAATVPLPGGPVVGKGDFEEKSLDDFPIDLEGAQ